MKCICMRGLLALVLIMFPLTPLINPIFLPSVHHLLYPEHYFGMPIDNLTICDSHVDLRYEDNMFNVHCGNVDTFESLGYFSGYYAALDPYCLYLVDKSRKIMWGTFFDFSFDFSMALSLIKRALIFFALILCMLSYCQACEPHAVEFDKLLRALTASGLNELGLEDVMEWLMLHVPQIAKRPYSLGAST